MPYMTPSALRVLKILKIRNWIAYSKYLAFRDLANFLTPIIRSALKKIKIKRSQLAHACKIEAWIGKQQTFLHAGFQTLLSAKLGKRHFSQREVE